MTKLIYPTLDIFLYDLREGLGQTEAEVEQNRNNFKQKLPQTINENRFIQLDEQSFEPEYVELLDKRIEPLHLPDDWQGDGYYYPVRLSDSYGLLLDGSLKEAQHLADLTWLHDMQTSLNGKLNGQTGTLGQTWMFSAQLPNVPAKEYDAIAKRCYEALIPGADYTENQMGHSAFLGGRLFELWRYTSPEQKAINQNHHIIIALYPDEDAAKKTATFYTDWMRLLMYRHKMMWAYNQSRFLKKRLKTGAVKIEECRKELDHHSHHRFNADKLQKTLNKAWQTLSDYTTALNLLEHQARTIEINLHNYQKRLLRIEEKAGQKMSFLEKLSDKVRDKYLLQVKNDYTGFSHQMRLLENITEYIRASVAIEEEKRDRAVINTGAIWGIGLATGAIVASISSQFPTTSDAGTLNHIVGFILDTLHLPETWKASGISIILSLSAAITAGLVTKLWIWIRNLRF